MTATVCWVGEKPLGSKNFLVGAETDEDIPDPGKMIFREINSTSQELSKNGMELSTFEDFET